MKDLSLIIEENVKLNVRTTLVAINDGKILVKKPQKENYYTLPGGRVKANEDSIEAIKREVMEETKLEIENLTAIGIIENFFKTEKYQYHEYMWLIKGEFKDKSKYKENIIGHEDEKELDFIWIDIDRLKNEDFRPKPAIQIIEKNDGTMTHIINHEDQ